MAHFYRAIFSPRSTAARKSSRRQHANVDLGVKAVGIPQRRQRLSGLSTTAASYRKILGQDHDLIIDPSAQFALERVPKRGGRSRASVAGTRHLFGQVVSDHRD